MKILFFYIIPPENQCYTKYSSGIASLSAVLKKDGHDTSLCVLDNLDKPRIISAIGKFQPDLLAYSVLSLQISVAKSIIEFAASEFAIPSVVGGVHATVNPEECLNLKDIIGVCVGEAEFALMEFVNALSSGREIIHLQNFCFKREKEIIRNPLYPLIQDLDSLPFPDRSLFSYNPKEALLGLEFFFSRGCPYQCSYCINPHLQKIYRKKGPFVRFRSPESVVEEIEQTLKLYDYDGMLTFHDDVFTLKKTWLEKFSILYKNRIGLPYRCNSTADKIDRETAGLLKSSNCKEVWFGIETGVEELRKTVLNKKIMDEDIYRAGSILNEIGVDPCSFNMLGIPGESEENIKRLIYINKKAGVRKISASLMQPYPGTRIYDECLKKGCVADNSSPIVISKGIGRVGISDSLLYKYYYLFRHYVFGGKYLFLLDFLYKFTVLQWMRRKTHLLPQAFKNHKIFDCLRGKI